MKERELFDVLESADDRQMDEIAESCPRLTDAQFERILAKSEKKYDARKPAEKSVSDVKEEMSDTVSGVERITRPVWLTPLYTAASLVLVVGMIAGGAFLFRHHGGSEIDAPMSGVVTTGESTSVVTSTAAVTAVSVTQTEVTTTAAEEMTTTSITTEVTNITSPVFTDEKLGKIAFDLAERSEEVYMTVMRFDLECYAPDQRIWFAFDDIFSGEHELNGYNGYNNYTMENGSVKEIPYTIKYNKVTDIRFRSTDDIRALLKSVYAEDNIFDSEYNCTFGPDLSDLETGDKLDADVFFDYIDYRGSLYCLGTGQNGYLGTSYFKDLPVIVTDKTDTSFTAYVAYANVPKINGDADDYKLLRACRKFSIVFDDTANDWRIKSQQDISYEEYTTLRETVNV